MDKGRKQKTCGEQESEKENKGRTTSDLAVRGVLNFRDSEGVALCGIGLLQIVYHGESWCVVKDAESWCWVLAMVLDAWTSRDNLHCKQRNMAPPEGYYYYYYYWI
ncbi:hypothetical protein H112_00144 [Trichophyton rubrum D6]|uniref:Uncharacterized protein n=2 Tax=Trichophyton TaxID=5550 RepID=A0A022WGV4_TRIRU|nr:hypothetical protein H100_00143 [Trichophyton rubrum MR850]EZF46991.1 hypothetical protein H102_00142 [Trichophyton rubrum CBS 100081]EZF57615.1 hypothetical protein H103_00144 [Trichophyton rubrum CBS 288.86]EZF68179.1 hypothetical protein H104_00143 [Trichophyton rubrum CBS 289.86]EZF78886.1 hypothetical protein H105_00133 [Trichophyton soudanense CBS 452.61]EZF89554.1 hypothetical protein H110_00144 [Trichophyton rubrum MR1448]EZG00280.1 hypothetical protein H113_00145 [Trichophyton rub